MAPIFRELTIVLERVGDDATTGKMAGSRVS
jgi:hypothetical protein